MTLTEALHIYDFLRGELLQTFELLITFVSLFGIIFYLLLTAENKKYFQKQK